MAKPRYRYNWALGDWVACNVVDYAAARAARLPDRYVWVCPDCSDDRWHVYMSGRLVCSGCGRNSSCQQAFD